LVAYSVILAKAQHEEDRMGLLEIIEDDLLKKLQKEIKEKQKPPTQDLGRISVRKNATPGAGLDNIDTQLQQAIPPGQLPPSLVPGQIPSFPPATARPATTPTTPSMNKKTGGGGIDFGRLIRELAPAAIGIGGGLALGGPAGAGFATGFAKSDQERRQREADALGNLEKATKESSVNEKQRKAIKSARNIVNTLKTQLKKIKAVSGPVARLKGAGLNISGAVGLDPNVSTFNNLRKSVLGQMAKIVSGESGRLTDQDIARIEAAIPRITDTTEERELAFKLLEGILSEQEAIFSPGSSFTSTGTADFSTLSDEDLDAKIAELEGRQ